MKQDNLYALLASVMGHIDTAAPESDKQLSQLQELLGTTLFDDDITKASNQEFSFQSSDIFFRQNIAKPKLEKIDDTVRRILSRKPEDNDLRLFIRDTPVRTTQVTGSVPAWAAGARLERTVGPIINELGRRIWVDFYKIEKLVSLYIQGQSAPVILFKASFLQRILERRGAPTPDITKEYTLTPGSVWIQAKLLLASAPADRYCGVRVKGGSITLDAAPQLVNGKLTIAANNNIQCKLQLEQPGLTAISASGKHGADARNMKLQLPANWHFKANATTHAIQSLDPVAWKVYGQEGKSNWEGRQDFLYNPALSRLLIPLTSSPTQITIKKCESPFQELSGKANIAESWWGLAAATLDINNPLEAEGNGALLILTDDGLHCTHIGQDGNVSSLSNPFFLLEPGRIGITDLLSNSQGAQQHFSMWKDDLNPHGTSLSVTYLKGVAIIYNTLAKGDEVLMTQVHADLKTDRPVKVNGEAVEVRSKNSVFILAANASKNFVVLYDDNIIWDHTKPGGRIPDIRPIALALENALFTVSPVNGCLLFGECTDDWQKLKITKLLLTFGMFSYLPTLPDPYAANLGLLRRQFERTGRETGNRSMWLWLVCLIDAKPVDDTKDEVKVSFHFGNMPGDTSLQLPQENQTGVIATSVASGMLHPEAVHAMRAEAFRRGEVVEGFEHRATTRSARNDYNSEWNDKMRVLENDAFALLDVSSKANQMGVSFYYFPQGKMALMRTSTVTGAAANSFPFQVQGMTVCSPGYFVRAFTVPQIAWEPVFNLSPRIQPMDPPPFFNYYPDDGGPLRIFNSNPQPVPLAPIPVVDNILESFKNPQTQTYSIFTLPFGLKAVAIISKGGSETIKPDMSQNRPAFKKEMLGGIQIKVSAGNFGDDPATPQSMKDSPMLPGYTLQLNNILGMNGAPNGTSTLGDSVTVIFNNEFWVDPLSGTRPMRGVPLTRIDWSGYGSNTFSNWLSPKAAFAQTSQARFDIMNGRTAHEVIQVRSILYPWGIRVVRTITLFRTSSNYVYRVDSGWQAESDGIFDFRYRLTPASPLEKPYTIHPGVVRGLFNIKNIVEDASMADFTLGGVVHCRPVWFDADVELENVVQGHHSKAEREGIKTGRVASRKILGYVQLAPSGVPLTAEQFTALMASQGGSIGGAINCQAALHNSNQQMRVTRFDMNVAVDKSGAPIFVAAMRGNVLLPKDGSWSMVQHNVGTGDVTPLPENITVPIIREGEWIAEKVVNAANATAKLVRVANPMDILRDAVANTINFGFLQSTGTQKALFLTPAFGHNINQLLSKTPPLMADAYRLMTGKGIFPNIGDAVNNFGKVVPLLNGVDNLGNAVEAFKKNVLEDGGKKVFELLEIKAEKQAEAVVKQGMELLQKGANNLLDKAMKFDIPDFEVPLVDIDVLKIYVEYKTGKNEDPPASYVSSKLNFDIDSFVDDASKSWKSRFNNLAMVVDLGSMKRLMTIKGNFDAKKGKETGFEGQPGGIAEGGLPTPEIEFHKDLKPVIDLLQMLGKLSAGDYKDVMAKGLKIAMGNAGEVWEYKFEASKELPLVRFPPLKEVYDAPTTPLKLEATMALGVYFNAGLKITSDAGQLLPTAGAFIQFHGGLSVMCVSLAAATIYAKGSVDLRIGANTQVGPTLDMKFGFGAEIVVGLPVVANVSVLYMISVEMHIDSAVIRVTAGMLFRGHAEILGGLVGVTITIEAKGTIERKGGQTNCSAQVTFAIDISIFLVIDISFSKTWGEQRQVA